MEQLYYFPQNALEFHNTVQLRNRKAQSSQFLQHFCFTQDYLRTISAAWDFYLLLLFISCQQTLFWHWLLLQHIQQLYAIAYLYCQISWLHLVDFRVKDGSSSKYATLKFLTSFPLGAETSFIFKFMCITYKSASPSNTSLKNYKHLVFRQCPWITILNLILDAASRDATFPLSSFSFQELPNRKDTGVPYLAGRSKCLSAFSYLLTSQ